MIRRLLEQRVTVVGLALILAVNVVADQGTHNVILGLRLMPI